MNGRRIATVFGGTGFLGHAVVQALASRGYIVRVPTRDLAKAEDLKLMGFVGQIVPIQTCVRSDAALVEVMRDSDVVVNLIGELTEHGRGGFQATHVETPARLARIAKAGKIGRFVHLSALGCGMAAKARYARTKAIGEEAVRAFFPHAVILRPSVLFGPRDAFLNKFALMARYLPFLPLIGGGFTKFQPVYVGDVAAAVVAVLDRPDSKGRTYALGGPQIYTFRELMAMTLAYTGLSRPLIVVPWKLARFKAFFLEFLPNPPLTRDQIELLKVDNILPVMTGASVASARNATGCLADLGIVATPMEDILPSYLGPKDEKQPES